MLSRHKTLNQCRFVVGPPSTTLDQLQIDIDSTSCVCCVLGGSNHSTWEMYISSNNFSSFGTGMENSEGQSQLYAYKGSPSSAAFVLRFPRSLLHKNSSRERCKYKITNHAIFFVANYFRIYVTNANAASVESAVI